MQLSVHCGDRCFPVPPPPNKNESHTPHTRRRTALSPVWLAGGPNPNPDPNHLCGSQVVRSAFHAVKSYEARLQIVVDDDNSGNMMGPGDNELLLPCMH